MTHKDLYKDRIAEASEQYAVNQLTDATDAVGEMLRLWREFYDVAVSGPEDRLLGNWVELASAAIHYSTSFATNYGAFITALGTPLMPGDVDSHTPTRVVEIPLVQDRPSCELARRVGSLHALSTQSVTFHQTRAQQGTDNWTMTVDLRNNPQKGMYFFKIAPYDAAAEDHLVKYSDYLDPHP